MLQHFIKTMSQEKDSTKLPNKFVYLVSERFLNFIIGDFIIR